ncbi:MAG: hypothetical protein ACRDTC_00860 [Pseudonocardiaceae bacterium]
MYAPTELHTLSSLIDGLEIQINEIQLPQQQTTTVTSTLDDTQETLTGADGVITVRAGRSRPGPYRSSRTGSVMLSAKPCSSRATSFRVIPGRPTT